MIYCDNLFLIYVSFAREINIWTFFMSCVDFQDREEGGRWNNAGGSENLFSSKITRYANEISLRFIPILRFGCDR